MDIIIQPSKLKGHTEAISSKSDAHRALIAASLCEEKTEIYLNCVSKDIEATVNCINSMGGKALNEGGKITVASGTAPEKINLDCNESGSTARFLLPVAAALCGNFEMNGKGRLPLRPFKEICDCMRNNGCKVSSNNLPLKVEGKLQSGVFEIAGNVSSQYISGLLFALPLLEGDSEIILTAPLFGYSVSVLNTTGLFSGEYVFTLPSI